MGGAGGSGAYIGYTGGVGGAIGYAGTGCPAAETACGSMPVILRKKIVQDASTNVP
jgi:hypothetical protein